MLIAPDLVNLTYWISSKTNQWIKSKRSPLDGLNYMNLVTVWSNLVVL